MIKYRYDMKDKKNKAGFTLIELTFAIMFISFLLLGITTVTLGIIASYRKGITIKNINSVGRDLIEDFTDTIRNSQAIDFPDICGRVFNPSERKDDYNSCLEDRAYHLIYQQWYAKVSVNGKEAKEAPLFGAFCTGTNSYIWNTGYTFGGGTNSDYAFIDDSGAANSAIPYIIYGADNDQNNHPHLLKFTDPTFSVCASIYENSKYEDTNSLSAPSVYLKYSLPVNTEGELLSGSTTPLAIYDLVIYPPAQNPHTKRLLYTASMVLATVSGGVQVNTSGNYCTPPGELELKDDFSYCAINKFNFSMRATGE